MAGCLTTPSVKTCTAIKSGGSNFLYLTDRSNVVSLTIGVSGQVTAITMVALQVFLKYEFASNKSQFLEPLTNENGLLVTQTYNMVWESWDNAKRVSLMEMAACNCGMVVIHGENTGLSWIWGFDETEEAYLLTSDRDSGTAKSDINQVAPVLQALATSYAREFTGVIPV